MAVPKAAITNLPESKGRGLPTVTSMKSRGAASMPEDRHRTRLAELPFLLEHDILKAKNIDSVPWDFWWDKRRYLVQPGETGYVPFPALVNKLGDPRSMEGAMTRFRTEDGQQGIIPTRYDSLCSLFATYGISDENIDALVEFAPKFEVRTMDGDILVPFPANQPDMPSWPVPQAPVPGRENSDTRRLIDKLTSENHANREELAELRAMVSERLSPGQPAAAAEPDPGETSDALAAALAGASVDPGPATQLR